MDLQEESQLVHELLQAVSLKSSQAHDEMPSLVVVKHGVHAFLASIELQVLHHLRTLVGPLARIHETTND